MELAEMKVQRDEMEKAWQLAYAGRECPNCGKWVTMNNDPDDVLERLEVK
jgi:ribosomal protein S27AE